MDNLTHSLVGLFLARTGFKRVTPLGTAVMVVAANIPDIDGISLVAGRFAYLHYHRNLTHSIAFAPIMALLAVGIVRACGRRPVRWLPAWGIALLGVASHLLLDLNNTFGVRLLLPFTGRWFSWDLMPLIDIGVMCILALGVIAPFLSGIVGNEIGEKRPRGSGGGWAFLCLLLLTGWEYSRSLLHDRALAVMNSHTFNGLGPRRTAVWPTADPLVWTGAAELSNAYIKVPVDLRGSFHPADVVTYYKPPRTPAMLAAMQTPEMKVLLEWVQYPLWSSTPAGDGSDRTEVTLKDMRFPTGLGSVTVTVK